MKNILYLLFILFLYIFFNNPIPASVGIGTIKILYLFAFVFLLFNNNSILVFKRYGREIFLYSILIVYIFLHTIIGSDSSMFRTVIVAFIESLILPIFLVEFYKKYLNDKDFYRPILIAGSIGATISSIAFFMPDVNTFLRTIQLTSEIAFEFEHRGYGLSEGLTFSYALVQSIIFFVGLNRLKYNKWFSFFIPLLFISVAFNARIGIVVLFVGLFIYLIQSRNIKTLLNLAIVLIIAVIFFKEANLENVNNLAVEWVIDFFNQMSDIFFNTQLAQSDTIGTLVYDMYVVPDFFEEWIVGRGTTMYGIRGGTDVGYLQLLNYGGLILIGIYAMLNYTILKRLLKNKSYGFFFFFMIVLLVTEMKGNFIPNSGGYRLLCLIYVFLIESNFQKSNIQNNNIINYELK